MIILSIDTAGTDCSAALYDSDSGALLATCGENIGRGHAEKLMAVIDEAVVSGGISLDDVEKVAVVVGPGSFTGIRVGVAAARGLGLALGVPVVGVSTLHVLAAEAIAGRPQAQPVPVVVAMDAKRDEVYLQVFSADARAMSPAVAVPLEEARRIAEGYPGAQLAGSGAALLTGADMPAMPDRFAIARVAMLGAVSTEPPKPLYLRGPDVRSQAGFAVARL